MDHDIHDPAGARAALETARRARSAAEQHQCLPRWYPAAHGGGFAATLALLGLAPVLPRLAPWLVVAGIACGGAFLALVWIVAHRDGVMPWSLGRARGRSLLLTAVPLLLALLAGVRYGAAGWFVSFGVVGGALSWLRLERRRARADADR